MKKEIIKNKDVYQIYNKCKRKIITTSKDKNKLKKERIYLMLFYRELLIDLENIINHNLDCSIEELSYYTEKLS